MKFIGDQIKVMGFDFNQSKSNLIFPRPQSFYTWIWFYSKPKMSSFVWKYEKIYYLEITKLFTKWKDCRLIPISFITKDTPFM